MMEKHILVSVTAVWLCLCGPAAHRVSAETWRERLQPIIETHCIDCHDGEGAEGGLDLSTSGTPALGVDLSDPETMRRWVLLHDRVAAGEMPPQGEPPLGQDTKKAALETLSATLVKADRARSDVVLRRLNRVEYENTVRDLFQTDVLVKEYLPQDNSFAGFDNVGEGLAVSAEAAQSYLRAADAVIDAVFGPNKEPARIHHVTNLLDQKTHDGKPFNKQIGKMFRRTDRGLVIFQSGYCPTNLVNFGRLRAPAGTYRGTMQVRAVQSDKPVTLRIYGGDTVVGRREKHLVGYFDVPPDEWTTIEFTDRLVEAGGTFQPKCYGTRDTRKDADTYPEPGIEIAEITIEGPLEEWPPPSRANLLGGVDAQHGTLEDAKRILARLLPRAFRRPVEPGELQNILSLVEAALDDGRNFEDALRLGLKGLLCSPQFLFLDEPGQDRISQHALAARLSYFLWSSTPDRQLLELADRGQLDRPDVLRAQVERLLSDEKSQALVTNFLGQWLDLRDIDFTTPDQNLYPEFDELLQLSMVAETQHFFREVLDRDLSVMNFIDSDFTFLNERLAKHYGIPGIEGQAFRRVDLPAGSPRGGVLTQASVLKVTANGTNTSPVLRGAWVLENILGQPAPPPPSDVPAVEPDIRGATTLRDQLARHRDDASCAVCHDRIDPAGFALENFDVIGGWREEYRSLGEGRRPDFSQHPITFAWVRYRIGLPVDASGQMADGTLFEGIHQFKQILNQQQHAVVTSLTGKLATYALGRRIGFSDRAEIEQIVGKVSEQRNGLRSLIHEIVQSEMFRSP